MITHEQIQHVRRGLGAFEGPVLSLYAGLAADGHDRAAIEARARNTLRALNVPRPIAHRVISSLDDTSRGAQTVAVFANEDELQKLELSADLPVVHPRTGYFDARWGRTYIAPFLLALDRFPRCAAVYIDRDHFRLFETFLGAVDEIDHAKRDEQGEPEAASDAQLELWFRLTAQRIDQLMDQRSIKMLVLMGPEHRVARFRRCLSSRSEARIIGVLPGLSSPRESALEVLGRIGPVVAQAQGRRQSALLDRVSQSGVSGVEPCVNAAARGDVECLLVPWMSGKHAFVDPDTGHIAGDADDRHVHRYPIRDLVAELALEGEMRIEFVDGRTATRLVDEFGGLAALRSAPELPGSSHLQVGT